MKDLEANIRIPGLLFWQFCVLSAVSGILATRYPMPFLAALLLIGLACGRRTKIQYLILLGCALAAFGWACLNRPLPPEAGPVWLDPAQYERMQGRVLKVDGLTDRRLRVQLDEVHPAGQPWAVLPGSTAWTWEQGPHPDQIRPLPGQNVTFVSKIRPITGFANEDLDSTVDYWAARDVWFTGWSLDAQGEVEIFGQAGWLSERREILRYKLYAALGGSSPTTGGLRGLEQVDSSQGMTQGQAIIPAVLLGDRYALNTDTVDLFTRAGLVHSLALSGQHLSLAFTVGALLAWLVSRGRGRTLLHFPRRGLILGLGLPFAGIYLWLGNAPLSLIRASLMMLLGALLWLGKRQTDLLDLLFFAVLCFILAWPLAVFDLSVQLSVLSVAGIALAVPLLRTMGTGLGKRLEGRPFRRPIQALAALTLVSLAVQIPSLPVVLQNFGRITPMFFLNLFWLPLLGIVVLPLGALGLFLLFLFGEQYVSGVLFDLAALPGTGMICVLEYLNSFSLLPVLQGLKSASPALLGFAVSLALFGMLAGRRQKNRATLSLALCALFLLPSGVWLRQIEDWRFRAAGEVRLRVLDVGQGQSLVVEWPNGRLLLDGGGLASIRLDPGEDIVAHALTVNRPPQVNLAIMSHGDLDHAGGLYYIFRQFEIGAALYPALSSGRDTAEGQRLEMVRAGRRVPLRLLEAGEVIDLGSGLALEIVHPPAKGRFSSNNSSLVIRLSLNGKGLALLGGDAQLAALRQMLATNQDLESEVLILPHHGSHTSLLTEFYEAVNPDLAVASCGAFNQYNFPRPEVVEALSELGVPVLTTAEYGEIRLTWDRHGQIALKTFRPEHFYYR